MRRRTGRTGRTGDAKKSGTLLGTVRFYEFLSPFQGSPGWGFHPGFRRSGSTLGYILAAASRLKVFAILQDINVMHNSLEGYFRKSCHFFTAHGAVKRRPMIVALTPRRLLQPQHDGTMVGALGLGQVVAVFHVGEQIVADEEIVDAPTDVVGAGVE